MSNSSIVFGMFDDKISLDEAKNLAIKIDFVQNNAETYINEYFQNVIRDVDLRREQLKIKIDDYSDELIESLITTEVNCIKLSKGTNDITNKIKQSKTVLDEFIKEKNKMNGDRFQMFKREFESDLDNYKKMLTNNKLSLSFFETPIQEVFGELTAKVGTKESNIMDSVLWSKLFRMSTKLSKNKWTLIYRGTRDGFGAKDFHRECDGVAKTVTIVKTTNGNIFGGYTDLPWSSPTTYIVHIDNNAFTFSLVNEKNQPFISMPKNQEGSIKCNSDTGPIFGNKLYNRDIYIASDSNMNKKSYSVLGNSFERTSISHDAEFILAGTRKFQTVEVEVFRIN